MINVKDPPYNARGDGITDDSDAIRAAIADAARTDETVFFPTGIFILASLIRLSNTSVSFLGSGYATILRSTIPPETEMPNGAPTMLGFSRCRNFSIRDITFDNNSVVTVAVNTCMLSMSRCENFTVANCALVNAKRKMLSIQSSSRFWIKENYFNCTELDGSVFTNAVALVDNISQNSAGQILNNEIVGAGSGGRGVDIVWAYNRITNFGYGAGIYSGHDGVGFGTHNWTIIGNTITGGQPARDENGLYPKGIEVYAPRSRIIGNTCYNNSGTGIVFGGRYSIVANNNCFDNGMPDNTAAGISASFVPPSIDPSYSIITGNICRNIAGGNQSYGFSDSGRLMATVALHFFGNDFSGNLRKDFSKAPNTRDYTWGDDPQNAPWLT